MVIAKEFIECLYRAIVKINRTKSKEEIEIPPVPEPVEEGKEVTEEEKQDHEKKIEEIKTKNDQIRKENEQLAVLQGKIKIEYRDYSFEDSNECAVVKLLNYREAPKETLANISNDSIKKIPEKKDQQHDVSKDESQLDDSKIESNKSTEKDDGTFEDVPPKIIL
jgi:TolA-binding protein